MPGVMANGGARIVIRHEHDCAYLSICHDGSTGEQQLFDIPITEAEAEAPPDAVTDDLGREAAVFVEDTRLSRGATVE
jgi:hypothetical protein